MDSLTHGLFGLSIAALRQPDSSEPGAPLSATDRAVLLACVVAAELPDLDYFWPAEDAVLVTLRAHRGLSHSLVAAPFVALVAAAVAKLVFRGARLKPVWVQALLSLLFAHLLPDLWTGWGTRLLLPFSDRRLTLDWTAVIDPLVTVPLLVGAIWAWRARRKTSSWRRPILIGLAVTSGYLGLRIGMQRILAASVAAACGTTAGAVFPAPLGVFTWRYVVPLPDGFAAGVVSVGSRPLEQRRSSTNPSALQGIADQTIAREVLAWARFPVVETSPRPEGGREVAIGDLRYHLRGEPTLRFVLEVSADGRIERARFDRGGSLSDVVRRWRSD